MVGKKKAKPVVVKRPASRQHSDSKKSTALTQPLEFRRIILAQGLQFDNSMLKVDWRVPDYLKKKLGSDLKIVDPKLLGPGKQKAYYFSPEQGVGFTIKVTMDKDEFKKALETINTHVIYQGHARYGRGPCFGIMPAATLDPHYHKHRRLYKGKNWADGEQSDKNGWLRMGFPYVPVPASEIVHYGYTPNLVEFQKGRPSKASCHPDIQKNYGKLRAYSIGELYQALSKQLGWEMDQDEKTGDKSKDYQDWMNRAEGLEMQLNRDSDGDADIYGALQKYIGISGDEKLRFWGYDDYVKGFLKRFLIHEAGWEGTPSKPWDLGATDMKCRVFCHFGCSTLKHNRPIIRGKKYKWWQKELDDRYAYFTDATTYMMTASRWIYHILTYPKSLLSKTGFRNLIGPESLLGRK
jgi:hypothetical protein